MTLVIHELYQTDSYYMCQTKLIPFYILRLFYKDFEYLQVQQKCRDIHDVHVQTRSCVSLLPRFSALCLPFRYNHRVFALSSTRKLWKPPRLKPLPLQPPLCRYPVRSAPESLLLTIPCHLRRNCGRGSLPSTRRRRKGWISTS